MLGDFTRSLSALVHFTLHTGAGVDSVVYSGDSFVLNYRSSPKLQALIQQERHRVNPRALFPLLARAQPRAQPRARAKARAPGQPTARDGVE